MQLSILSKFIKCEFSEKQQLIKLAYSYFKFRIFLAPFLARVGKRSIVGKPIYVTPGYIFVGNSVFIKPGCRMEGVNKYEDRRYSPSIVIEDGVTIEQNCHITAADRLVIGANSLISSYVLITDISHEYHDISKPVGRQPIEVKNTSIGSNCFIGSGAKILPGTVLGSHCIVGSNAVVQGAIPDYCVVVGVPAVVVKRFNQRTHTWCKTNPNGDFLDVE